ncbi:hypothetical protein [Paenibacillus agilis]|uniref:Uncharacterized protein n=1 Tax=Paenibacillus agilis TaxID=3020863 RepID=A0A559IE86_9BACL|nr:hypothetical protein [Paenibacillus agilis]TVX85971.1 hypothetical protein FPZ44_23755 [Paenibacillus agilis]
MNANIEDINQRFAGKVFMNIELHEDNESAKINFTDGSFINVELDYVNESCHCHPEYRYYLEIQASEDLHEPSS